MSLITLLKKGLTILNLELFKTLTTLSQKRVEILILIAVLFVITLIIYFVNKSKTDRKDLSTICAASIFIEISFALPIALNLSFQKEGSGPVLLQSLLTISGGLVVLLGYIENRRKNNIDESKNIDEKNQKMHASRYERNTKSIELIFSQKTPAAISAVHSLCKITDEWVDEYINGDEKTNRSSKQEAQSIINVLCAYVREYGKPSSDKHHETVCKIIMKEIHNRLNKSDNGYSDWSDFTFDFEGATFTYPIIFKNVADINKINLDGCTFVNDLEIYFSIEYNNQDTSREIIINHCTFKGSVILASSKFTQSEIIRATASNIALEDSHFAKGSKLEIKNLCPPDYYSEGDDPKSKGVELPIYVYGDLPANTSFKNTPQSHIIIGQKYDSRDPNYSGAIQHTTIQGNILIEKCDNASFEIPDRHTFNGEINISCSEENLNEVKINDCILNEKATIKAANIKEMGFIDTIFNRGLDIDCSEKIETLTACNATFHINGSTNHQGVDFINSKSKVTIKAQYITLLNLNGSNFYTRFILEVPEIEKMEAIRTKFHVKPNLSKTKTIKNHDFSNCEYYDSNQKKYIPLTHP